MFDEKNQKSESVTGDVIQPEIIAAISAAVALSLETKVRVVRIRRTTPDLTWQRIGRAAIMSSHYIKR